MKYRRIIRYSVRIAIFAFCFGALAAAAHYLVRGELPTWAIWTIAVMIVGSVTIYGLLRFAIWYDDLMYQYMEARDEADRIMRYGHSKNSAETSQPGSQTSA